MRLHPREIREVLNTASRQYGLISHRQARHFGIDDNRIHLLLRRREWGRLLPDVYTVRDACADRAASGIGGLRRAVKAAQLALGPGAVASGPTAARLWGMEGLPAWNGGAVHMNVPASCRRVRPPGVRTSTWYVGRHEVACREGLPLTEPARTLRDTVLCVDRDTAVSLMDSALAQGLITGRRLFEQPRLNEARAGGADSERWWWLADPRARSPLETRARLICADAGVSPDDLYHPVPLPGGGTAHAPLWWERGPVVADPDRRLSPDQDRALRRARPGLRLLRFTTDDLARPQALVAAVSEALR